MSGNGRQLIFRASDPRAKNCYIEMLACVCLLIKDNPMDIHLAIVKVQTADSLTAFVDEGAHIFDISSSLMKRNLFGEGKIHL